MKTSRKMIDIKVQFNRNEKIYKSLSQKRSAQKTEEKD